METNSGRSCGARRGLPNDIIFAIDELDYPAASDYSRNEAISSPTAESRKRSTEQRLPTAKSLHPRSTKTRVHAPIRPLIRQRPPSGKAGDVTSLDHWIAGHGGTTSSYEELSHRIQSFKYSSSQSSQQRVEELTREKSFLLQELMYFKASRTIEAKFFEAVNSFCVDMETTLARLKDALNERSKARTQAEADLCNYWGIDFADGNVEDAIF